MLKCILSLMLACGAVFADSYLDHCQFQATLLVLKPTIDQNSYVITSTNNRFGGEVYPNGKRHFIHTDFKAGFRVEALCPASCYCDNMLSVRFAHFDTHDRSSTRGDFLFDTIGFPGNGAQSPEDTTYHGVAALHQRFTYYAADATINRPLFCDYCDHLTFLFGLHTTYIKFHSRSRTEGTFLSDGVKQSHTLFNQESKFWGLGPEVGIDYNYIIPCLGRCGQIAFNLNARASLLASCTRADLHYITNRTGPVGVNLKNKDPIFRLNPAYNVQIGFNYSYSFCNFDTIFEIGYELMWYNKSINKITGYDVAFAGDTWDAFEDLSLQGPFARINIAF